jgi:hypothetical protein
LGGKRSGDKAIRQQGSQAALNLKGEDMTTAITQSEQEDGKVKVNYQGGSSEAVYGLGLIGAWVYYIGRATNFQEGVVGFLKGLVWPAFLVYEVLVFLNKE